MTADKFAEMKERTMKPWQAVITLAGIMLLGAITTQVLYPRQSEEPACSYFADDSAASGGDGTQESPWQIREAFAKIASGDYRNYVPYLSLGTYGDTIQALALCLLPGVYPESLYAWIPDGTAEHRLIIRAYEPGSVRIPFDFGSPVLSSSYVTIWGVTTLVSQWEAPPPGDSSERWVDTVSSWGRFQSWGYHTWQDTAGVPFHEVTARDTSIMVISADRPIHIYVQGERIDTVEAQAYILILNYAGADSITVPADSLRETLERVIGYDIREVHRLDISLLSGKWDGRDLRFATPEEYNIFVMRESWP